MELNENAVLFDGGKQINISGSEEDGNEGFKIEKKSNGDWKITIDVIISADEAKKTIHTYDELEAQLNVGEKIEDVFPNMIYFTANKDGKAVYSAPESDSCITPIYDKNDFGYLNVKLKLGVFGKTQNGKTQNFK